VCAGLKTGYDHMASDTAYKEKITFLKFGSLECRGSKGVESSCPALLLALDTGFQLWSLSNSVKEIVSRRDGPARSVTHFLCPCASLLRSKDARMLTLLRSSVITLIGVVMEGVSSGLTHCAVNVIDQPFQETAWIPVAGKEGPGEARCAGIEKDGDCQIPHITNAGE
jgi:hypothetical protein